MLSDPVPLMTFQELRLERQLSLDEVSMQIGVSPNELAGYEEDSGSIPSRVAVSLCSFYEVSSIGMIYIGKSCDRLI